MAPVMGQFGSLIPTLPLITIALVSWPIVWIVYARFFHPLSEIPGPFLASVTRFWYVVQVRKGKFDRVNRKLHARYDDNAIISRLLLLVEIVVYTSVGRFVRISPNEVSISDPSAVQTIYGIKSKFTKTVWYSVWRNHTAKTKHADQFGDMDEKHHAARRRLLSNMYAMTSILESEPYIDDCTQLFMIKLGEVADGKTSVDLGRLLQLYAFDVIGELYFGSKFGFIEAGRDLQGFVDALEKRMPTSVTLANLPPLWRPLYVRWRALRTAYSQGDTQAWLNLSNVATDNVSERQRLLQAEGNISYFRNGRKDMLTKLFNIQVTKGDKEEFGFYDIVQEGNVGVFAGSDTTAVALRAIVYQVLTHPSVLTRLQNELDTAVAEGRLTIPVKYSDANRLPYFCACVKEAMRLHPSVGLQLPRYVPAGGCEIGGHFFPEGMAVGINPAVLHYQTSVFGPDAVEYNPERWLREDAGTMDRYLLTFGGGSRTCIGKNISLAEIHKMLPTLFLTFEMELTYERPFETHDQWFHRQEGLDVRLRRRNLS